jgi:PEP-CTERM motif-containing protein
MSLEAGPIAMCNRPSPDVIQRRLPTDGKSGVVCRDHKRFQEAVRHELWPWGEWNEMTKKVLLALGCLALLALMTSAVYADSISFTFLGVKTTPPVTITKAGGVSLSSAPLLSISDSDTNNVFVVPGTVDISTGPAGPWVAAGGLLTADFASGGGIEVQVDSANCIGGTMPGVCLQGILNTTGSYVAFQNRTGSFQAVFTVTYVSPWVPGLFGDPLPWLPQGSDSFTTGNNRFNNGGLTDSALVGAGSVTYQPVPEPGTLALVGTGVLGLAGFIRRKGQ